MRRWLGLLFTVVMACSGADLRSAHAADADPTAAAEAAAAAKRNKAHDYRGAAEGYEAAFNHQPEPKWMLLAARARQKSGDLPQAAIDYARYLKVAPEKAPQRATAKKELAKLDASLGRVDIKAAGAASLTLDGQPLDPSIMPAYASPGSHVVEGKFGSETVSESFVAAGGQLATVVLEAPAAPPVAAAPAKAAETPAPPPSRDGSKPLPPLVVYVGAGATGVLGGLALWSGLDVLSQKDTFDAKRSRENLDEGKSKQLRTNVLLGVTGAAAVFTVVAAVFFVDWKGRRTPARTQVGVGPGAVTLGTTF